MYILATNLARKKNTFSTGTNFTNPWLSACPIGCVKVARCCAKMYSYHLFPCGGVNVKPTKRDEKRLYSQAAISCALLKAAASLLFTFSSTLIIRADNF